MPDTILHEADEPARMFASGEDFRKVSVQVWGRLVCRSCERWQWFEGSSFAEGRKALAVFGWTSRAQAGGEVEDFCRFCQPKGTVPVKPTKAATVFAPPEPVEEEN